MSYVPPADVATAMVDAGQKKTGMATREALIKATMAGAILALAAALATTITVNTGEPLLGAMIFPVGFILLYLMGFDLVTGVFTLVPLAWIDKRPGVTWRSLLRNWGLVFLGNMVGAVLVALLMSIITTYGFSTPPDAIGERLGEIGHDRTAGYAEHGAAGMLTLFLRAVMCNWMVSTGVVASMMSRSAGGKALLMWMPVMLFFYMGFEHSVVNMFLFPAGLMLGGDFSLGQYLVWNEIPTLLGNIVGGLLFVGLPMYYSYVRTPKTPQTPQTPQNGDAQDADDPQRPQGSPVAGGAPEQVDTQGRAMTGKRVPVATRQPGRPE